jgi:hypothetical protein
MRKSARCELLRDILGRANIDGTQNIFARAGGMSEWMRDMVGGRENAKTPTVLTSPHHKFALFFAYLANKRRKVVIRPSEVEQPLLTPT